MQRHSLMIAIDSNVLLRYLLQDDPAQSKQAAALITGDEDVLITDVVLVKTMWTLNSRRRGINPLAQFWLRSLDGRAMSLSRLVLAVSSPQSA